MLSTSPWGTSAPAMITLAPVVFEIVMNICINGDSKMYDSKNGMSQ